jgi:hypothetical protein
METTVVGIGGTSSSVCSDTSVSGVTFHRAPYYKPDGNPLAMDRGVLEALCFVSLMANGTSAQQDGC